MILCALLIASALATSSLCPRPCKCFTTNNGIQAANCTDLPDQMTTAWPQKILRIHFDGHHASPIMLKNKAFKHFPRLTYLDITGGSIQYVGNLAFDGLPELVELNLVGTGIRKLHQNTFASNRKLAFLSLRNNPRLFVAPSFLVSESITELDLSECALSTLKSVYFKSLPNLKYLFVMKNELKFLGSQFGPSALKYVNLADNHIENIYEDLDVYKRLRTIDLTGNPINCTCELSEIDTKLTARGVAFGNTVKCKNTGKPLGDLVENCSDKEMMGDDPGNIMQIEGVIPINNSSKQLTDEFDDFVSGSGSGDGGFILSSTENNSQSEDVKNNSQIEYVSSTTQAENVENTQTTPLNSEIEEIITKTNISDLYDVPSSSTEVTETSPSGSTIPNVSPAEVEVKTTTLGPEEDTSVYILYSTPSAETANDSLILGQSSKDRGILPQTIQAAEVPQEDDVQTQVTKYLQSNVLITGTALILAVVIIAIVYKAVCLGKSRRRDSNAQDSDKSVELKDIKYVPAETEDNHSRRGDNSPGSSVEDNLLDDHDDSGDDDEDNDGDVTSPPVDGHRAPNGLLNSVMDAVKNNIGEPASNGQYQDPQVPTRVVVKLSETPKASKPITINNVH